MYDVLSHKWHTFQNHGDTDRHALDTDIKLILYGVFSSLGGCLLIYINYIN